MTKKIGVFQNTPIFMNLYNKSYFEVARRLQKRSLLSVNEHFAGKANAERALLDNFIFLSCEMAVS